MSCLESGLYSDQLPMNGEQRTLESSYFAVSVPDRQCLNPGMKLSITNHKSLWSWSGVIRKDPSPL